MILIYSLTFPYTSQIPSNTKPLQPLLKPIHPKSTKIKIHSIPISYPKPASPSFASLSPSPNRHSNFHQFPYFPSPSLRFLSNLLFLLPELSRYNPAKNKAILDQKSLNFRYKKTREGVFFDAEDFGFCMLGDTRSEKEIFWWRGNLERWKDF